MSFTVSAGFIGEFKTGDNINYNLRILKLLYRQQATAQPSEAKLLCKPITVLVASIAEALLHDLFWRMKWQTSEAKSTFAKEVLADVKEKHLDEFNNYIQAAQKHELLGPNGDAIYDQLHDLRKRRNRIHIQNSKKLLEPNEKEVFTQARQVEAEILAEKVLKLVSNQYPRPKEMERFVNNMQFPWDAHLP